MEDRIVVIASLDKLVEVVARLGRVIPVQLERDIADRGLNRNRLRIRHFSRSNVLMIACPNKSIFFFFALHTINY
jgi:hypothetical protein